MAIGQHNRNLPQSSSSSPPPPSSSSKTIIIIINCFSPLHYHLHHQHHHQISSLCPRLALHTSIASRDDLWSEGPQLHCSTPVHAAHRHNHSTSSHGCRRWTPSSVHRTDHKNTHTSDLNATLHFKSTNGNQPWQYILVSAVTVIRVRLLMTSILVFCLIFFCRWLCSDCSTICRLIARVEAFRFIGYFPLFLPHRKKNATFFHFD